MYKVYKKNLSRAILTLIIGILLIITALIAYIPEPQFMKELTFISNMLIGILFIVTGVLELTSRRINGIVYAMAAVIHFIVFFITVGGTAMGLKFNFKGAMMFLHVINPVLTISYYLTAIKHNNYSIKMSLLIPVPFFCYMVFDYFYGWATGTFMYDIIKAPDYTKGNWFFGLIAGVLVYLFAWLVSLGIYYINKALNKKRFIG